MDNSNFLIDTIMKASDALASQDQQTAIDTLSKITSEVANDQKLAEGGEQSAKTNQESTINKISELILAQGKANEEYDATNVELQRLYGEITVKKVAVADVIRRINEKNNDLNNLNNQLRNCQSRIDDLNDTSLRSIVISIFSLGMDRAVKAISIDINGARNQISNDNNTIAAYQQHLNELHNELANDNIAITNLQNICNEKNNRINQLKSVEIQMHEQEEIQRKKLVYYTEVNAFYIKLEGLLNNISNRLNDVADIVRILDNNTPTIASFDPSTPDLITLKQAIVLFKNAN